MTISCIPIIVDTINFSGVDGFLIDHVDMRLEGPGKLFGLGPKVLASAATAASSLASLGL